MLAGSVASSRPVTFDAERLVRNLMTITGVHNYRPHHLDLAVAFLTRCHRRYQFADMVDGCYQLDGINDAFDAAATTPSPRQAIVGRLINPLAAGLSANSS